MSASLPFFAVPLLYVILQWSIAKKLAPHTNIPGISLVAIFAVAFWVFFHLLIEPAYGNFLLYKFIVVPTWVKCPFTHPKCVSGDLDGWSLYHLLDHFLMGLLYPHLRLETYFVFFQSQICEFGELIAGERARFIVDPGVNVLGYVLGCLANRCLGWGGQTGSSRRINIGSVENAEEKMKLVEVVIH